MITDVVSALTTAQFAAPAQMCRAIAAQAAAIYEKSVALAISTRPYVATETADPVATNQGV